jgi:HK97 family phage prohead protease
MTNVLYHTIPLALEVRADGDGRTIAGTVVPYGETSKVGGYGYVESFVPGAFAGTDPAAVPLLAQHDRERLPIGIGVSLTDSSTGLDGEFRVSKTRFGDDVLELIRDGALTGLSIGFLPMADGDHWSQDRTRVERHRAQLVEVSVVGFPAYDSARIASLRAALVPATPRLYLARLRRR